MTPRSPHFPPRPAVRDDGALRALRRRRRRRRIRQGVAWTAAMGLAGAVGFGIYFGGQAGLGWVRDHTRLLEVRKIQPEPTLSIPTWDLVEAAGVVPGDDILELSSDAVEARLERLPRISGAEVTRRPDGSVLLSVQERMPVALCFAETALELDPVGVILGPAPPPREPLWPGAESKRGPELPIVSGVDLTGRAPGEQVADRGLRQALAFLSRLRAYGFDGSGWISEVRADTPDDLVLYTLQGGFEVRVGDGRLSRTKLRALFEVLSRAGEDSPPVRSVDLRFHNQVVVRRG